MSWSIDVPEASENIIEAILEAPVTGQDINETHVYKATEAAREAATELISSGAFGAYFKTKFKVRMGGHANVQHQPSGSWVNDCVTISVAQIT